ncbi:hypothetical protein PMI41_03618 [Phyllobacterium sp. YR531]|nr:hypothetical protein PMI41_03618 [Phyllobacterium sp. YR531]
MIGLFLPRQRVVSLLSLQHSSYASGPDRPLRLLSHALRNGSLTLARNIQQDGGRDVSASI